MKFFRKITSLQFFHILLLTLFSFALFSCASTPKQEEKLPEDSVSAVEIPETENSEKNNLIIEDSGDDNFEEEEVQPETDVYIPPRPPKRIHNPDGTITDPEIIRVHKEREEKAAEERRKIKEAKLAAKEAEEAEKANSAENENGVSDSETAENTADTEA